MLTMRHSIVMVVALSALLGILLTGHIESAEPPGVPLLGSAEGAAPAVPGRESRCSSPYDGVWGGTLIGVSQREDFVPNFREGISFDLTLKLSCVSVDMDMTSLEVTEARASYWPLGCTDGCRPAKSAAFLGPPGRGGFLYLELPNGVAVKMEAEISGDGKYLQGRSGEPVAWTFGHASRCPELTGRCKPITGSFTLTKEV